MMLYNLVKKMPIAWQIFCLCFIFFQLLCIVKCRELMPFYLYGMYSSSYSSEEKIMQHWEIKVNGKKWDWESMPNLAEIYAKNNIQLYVALQTEKGQINWEENLKVYLSNFSLFAQFAYINRAVTIAKVDELTFRKWLINLLQNYARYTIENIEVYKQDVSIAKGKITKLQQILVF